MSTEQDLALFAWVAMILRGSKLAQSICESRGYLDRRIAFLRLYTGVLRLKQERGEYSGRRLGVTF